MTFNNFLETAPEFSNLTEQDIENFQRIMCVREYPAGHEFCKEGTGGHEAHLIINGEISVTHKRGVERGSLEINRLKPGNMFGIVAIMTDKKHEASYRAVGPVTVATMPGSSFKLLYESNSKLGLHFQQFVVTQLAKDYQSMIDLLRRVLFANSKEEALSAFNPMNPADRRAPQDRRQSAH